jgi:hypothetical protein
MATKETKNPYHDVLVAIAQGKMIQFRTHPDQSWRGEDNYTVLTEVAQGIYNPSCYRVKPSGIEANGFVIPRPLKVKPLHGEDYYYLTADADCSYGVDSWDDYDADQLRFNSRLIWATEDDAKAAVVAIRELMNT